MRAFSFSNYFYTPAMGRFFCVPTEGLQPMKKQLRLTKAGAKMNENIRQRVVEVMTKPENDGLSQIELAQKADVTARTLRNYLTPELWEEVRKLRLTVVKDALAVVDQAMYAKAIKGDTTAARLLYTRWEEMKNSAEELETELPQTLAELNQELAELQKQIHDLEKTG